MRSTFKTVFYVNGSKEKSGIVPIMGRVTINGTIAQFSCKQSISKELWDAKANRAKGKSRKSMDVNHALEACKDLKVVRQRLQTLKDLGLGYLTLGEATPSLSGGEAQRLKLASEMGRRQEDSIFVFDEPTIGLHPLDVKVLINVFQKLIDNRATIIVIEHDLDVIRNADYVIDMGPEGGKLGGEVVFSGTPEDMVNCPASKTGRYLK